MKIAFVVPGFSADEHDWCIPAHTDIVRTLALRHQVHVFAMRYPHRVDEYAIGQATVHSFNGVGSRGGESARLWQAVLAGLARENRRGRFDVIHAIFGSEAGCVATLAGKFLRVPPVVWMVNGEMVGLREIGYGADLLARQRWMNRLILRYADLVLCTSAKMVKEARRRNPRMSVELLPLGVNLRRFHVPTSPVPAPEGDEPRFVNVGSLVPVKDQATLLRAFAIAILKMPNALLAIAGAGPLHGDLRELANEQGIAARVTFAGNVPHDALPEMYQAAAVFVQASHHEGQGMALLEAAACGCAVCGTDVGALADLAARGGAIASVVGDPAGLANAMERAFRGRAGLGLRARALVEREYNLESVTARLESIYMRLRQGEKPFGKSTIARA